MFSVIMAFSSPSCIFVYICIWQSEFFLEECYIIQTVSECKGNVKILKIYSFES